MGTHMHTNTNATKTNAITFEGLQGWSTLAIRSLVENTTKPEAITKWYTIRCIHICIHVWDVVRLCFQTGCVQLMCMGTRLWYVYICVGIEVLCVCLTSWQSCVAWPWSNASTRNCPPPGNTWSAPWKTSRPSSGNKIELSFIYVFSAFGDPLGDPLGEPLGDSVFGPWAGGLQKNACLFMKNVFFYKQTYVF